MKEKFERVEVEVITFSPVDIIASSDPNEGELDGGIGEP
jgi:hypothetical protein